MDTIQLADLTIHVVRKRMKNMYIRVKADGCVTLSAPRTVSDKALQQFAQGQQVWIESQLKRLAARPVKSQPQFLSGEIHYLWGHPYSLEVTTAGKNAVLLLADKIILQVRGRTTSAEREAILDSWYREQLAAAIPAALAKGEAITGVQADEWRIKKMKTRWGTCNVVKKRIWFNLQLARKAPECLDYIVIHELTHLYEKSHNAVFKAYMNRFYPSWREVRKRLNSQEI